MALAEVALVVAAAAAGCLLYSGFFATLDYLPVLGLACLAAGVTATVAAARRWRTWSTLLLAVAGCGLVATYGAFGDTVENGLPTAQTGSAILAGSRNGWHRMITVAVPADVWGDLLVMPILVAWVAVFLAVTLTLRTKGILAPVPPPLGAFLFALVVVGNQRGGHTTATVVFLTAALCLIAVRAHRINNSDKVRIGRQRSRPIRTVIAAGLAVAVSALVGIVGAHALPLSSGRPRFDPRTLYLPPITFTDTITPLARLKPQLTERPPRTLFAVRIDQEAATLVDRVRTTVLDVFDGTTWTSMETYHVAGSHLAVDPALHNAQPVTARIELMDFAGPHLPVLGWPSRLTAAQHTGQFGFNATAGVVVSTASVVRGLRYDLAGQISSRDGGLPLASPSTITPEHAYARTLSANPPVLLPELANRLVAARPTPYSKLTALERYLHSLPYNLSGSPPGHSYAAIIRLLTGKSTGYAEQHATAFTVLARSLGFPARVAVGYRLRNFHGGAYNVTTADAHAWPEVHFTGYGWVPFEPTDTSDSSPPPPVPPPEIPRVVPPQSTSQPAAQSGNPGPTASSQAPRDNQSGFGWTGILHDSVSALIAVAVLIVLTAGAITAVKAGRRRHRRHASDHATCVLGAWHELVDRLTERGIALPVSLTAREVIDHVRMTLGTATHPIAAIAPLVTTAVFAPEHLGQREAERAWHLVDQLRTMLYPRRVSVTRLRAAVHPRPLWTSWLAERQRRRARQSLEMGRYR
ncbi:hypothetical protein ALI144C_07175 [Actinosynnema sp. ALI-1.44]|uniref:transglutaminase TgpA family protein n=1 Tax=Actinosynnema sp. ALI-1.44 TaxID=1933779 RepID=UPI0009D0F31B|nr:transglutaminaseTgpA domain-containing protein [Actinosynnema sp. ALI-1.44]ONI88225.1 hypothetical protein ALI144C_07175 [Actinosynnema sp. ALI-1.44]